MVLAVITAEFDIDAGNQVRLAYPAMPQSFKASTLSDAMLPEGAHHTAESDWTLAVLDNIVETPAAAQPRHAAAASAADTTTTTTTTSTSSASAASATTDAPRPLLLYSLVRTKMDSRVKRGATMRSIGIITRYTFFHVLKVATPIAHTRIHRTHVHATC